jgi:hypothetical protein
MEKSNSTKIRNKLVELSYIESSIYKSYFVCLSKNNNKDICKTEYIQEIRTLKENVKKYSLSNAFCLGKCSNYLNFPSKELTCYDSCEEEYYNKLCMIINEIIKK